eukprot:TRINITY_DN526_c0_g1_i1.p1 TRINITY_DN526_c0_g1~~TRINITY_DN526_c0_g1_i1.p1  ORF type:complete len:375 (+),score=105.79 TRINITY_DN526_c0_g1_i1:55-1125(+)
MDAENLLIKIKQLRYEKDQVESKLSEALDENGKLKKEVITLKTKLKQVAEKISHISKSEVVVENNQNNSNVNSTSESEELPARRAPEGLSAIGSKRVKPPPRVLPSILQSIWDEEPNGISFKEYNHPVFSVKLSNIITANQPIPYLWRIAVKFLLSEEALSTIGLFRIPGSQDDILYYKKLFDEGRQVTLNPTTCSVHDVAGLLKEFIRNLPEPIIPNVYNSQVQFIVEQYKKIPSPNEQQQNILLNQLLEIVSNLPTENYTIFKILILLMSQIVSKSDVNKMNVDNIIKCIVPTTRCYPALFFYTLNNTEYFFGDNSPTPSSFQEVNTNKRRPNNNHQQYQQHHPSPQRNGGLHS